jgi:general L-amino acid transport system substrate-binding protein
MIQAEEFGLTAANVDKTIAESQNPDVQRFLGVIEEKGKELGMPNDFAVQIIKQVGNYGESFDRNVGTSTPLKIERGLNALWKDGGLMYNPPFR